MHHTRHTKHVRDHKTGSLDVSTLGNLVHLVSTVHVGITRRFVPPGGLRRPLRFSREGIIREITLPSGQRLIE